MREWRTGPLGDFIELKRGYDLSKAKRRMGDVPIVSSSGVSGCHDEFMVAGPGVVTGRYGTIGKVFYIEGDFWPLNTTLYVRDFKDNDRRFVAYYLQTFDFDAHNDKSSVPGVNRNHLHATPAAFPPVGYQRAIAEVLGALDDKIEVNQGVGRALDHMAMTLFRRAMSSVQEWTSVGAQAEFHNRQRVPMSKAERSHRAGEFPYYGAAGQIDAVDDWIFDGDFILVGEDGTVMDAGGHPVVQRVEGRFWVNNHAHVLTARAWSHDILELAVRASNVAPLVTGAVQPKVSMRSLSNLPLPAFSTESASSLAIELQPLLAQRQSARRQNATLAATRDALLPKLMSGELRVKDVEHRVEAVL